MFWAQIFFCGDTFSAENFYYNSRDRMARTGQSGQDCQDRMARAELPGQDSHNRTGKLSGKDCQEKGQPQ
jgi:hypothetical protein